jgi:23S rRNA (uridine2552-2'-O)-methyltransferase
MRLEIKRLFSGNKAWIQRHVNDSFVKQAAKDDLRSRSAYKFIEIQDKYKLVKPSDFVVDLGAAPGGWSVAVAGKLDFGKGGMLCALDLLPFVEIPHVKIIQGDFNSPKVKDAIAEYSNGRQIDVVISDMLQNTSGIKSVDHFKSIDLCLNALEFSSKHVIKNGSFLCKFLRGVDDNELLTAAKLLYDEVKVVKPKASRSESTEIYLLATKKKA